jgi:hypothetical protein
LSAFSARDPRLIPRAGSVIEVVANLVFAIFCWILTLKDGVFAEISGANLSAARTIQITHAINLGMARAFPAALLVGVVILLVDAYRIFRVKTTETQLPRNPAVALV